MKNIISLFVLLSLSFNLTYAQNKNAISSYSKYSYYNKSSYFKIVEDLIKGELKKGMKLSNTEKAVITKFRDGKRQPSSKIKHLISALGKHKCVSISKTASLKAWPAKSSIGKFYEFECNSTTAKKLGPAIKDNKKVTKTGTVITKPGTVSTKPSNKKGKMKLDLDKKDKKKPIDNKLSKNKKEIQSKNPKKLNPKTK